ncbi:MAG: hypothetical protein LUE92_11445 [Clostridiales bacterium]|nr:hypothetical protein [Clostridiales bacterium]
MANDHKEKNNVKNGIEKDMENAETLSAIAEEYKSGKSLRSVSADYDLPVAKTRKLLITAGVYHTEVSDRVNELWKEKVHKYANSRDMDEKQVRKIIIAEICEETGLKSQTVYSYLPYMSAAFQQGSGSDTAVRKRRQVERKKLADKVRTVEQDAKELTEYTSSLDEEGNALFTEFTDALWESILKFEGYTFETVSGEKFTYSVLSPKQIKISKKQKPITKASVDLAAYRILRAEKHGEPITAPKKLGVFGASYILPIVITILDYGKGEEDHMETDHMEENTLNGECQRCHIMKPVRTLEGYGYYCEGCYPVMKKYLDSAKAADLAMEQSGGSGGVLEFVVNDGSYSTTMEIHYIFTVAGCWWSASETAQISTEYVKSAAEKMAETQEDKVKFMKSLISEEAEEVGDVEMQHRVQMFQALSMPGSFETDFNDRGNDCERAGYHFEMWSEPDCSKAVELKQFKRKITEGIQMKGLHYQKISWMGMPRNSLCLNGKSATIGDKGEAVVDYDEGNGTVLVIDGWRITAQQFFNIISAQEGGVMKFKFVDSTERMEKKKDERKKEGELKI